MGNKAVSRYAFVAPPLTTDAYGSGAAVAIANGVATATFTGTPGSNRGGRVLGVPALDFSLAANGGAPVPIAMQLTRPGVGQNFSTLTFVDAATGTSLRIDIRLNNDGGVNIVGYSRNSAGAGIAGDQVLAFPDVATGGITAQRWTFNGASSLRPELYYDAGGGAAWHGPTNMDFDVSALAASGQSPARGWDPAAMGWTPEFGQNGYWAGVIAIGPVNGNTAVLPDPAANAVRFVAGTLPDPLVAGHAYDGIQVEAIDTTQGNARDTGYTGAITLGLDVGITGYTLAAAQNPVNAVAGVATFSGVVFTAVTGVVPTGLTLAIANDQVIATLAPQGAMGIVDYAASLGSVSAGGAITRPAPTSAAQTVTITGTVRGSNPAITATAQYTVPASGTPPVGSTGVIRGECTDRRGVPLNGLEFPVDSSDPSVCTVPDSVVVDDDGTFEIEVTGVGVGSAIVQVQCGDVMLATPVTVS